MSRRFDHEYREDGVLFVHYVSGIALPAQVGFKDAWNIQQGAKSSLKIAFVNDDADGQPWDLSSGWTAACKARKSFGNSTALFSLTNGSGITLSAATPNITLTLDTATTAALDFTAGVFDVELALGGEVLAVLTGTVVLHREATTS